MNFILTALKKKKVVPVIGNDLSLVNDKKGPPVPLYKYIAGKIAPGDKESGKGHNIHELTLKPHAARIPHIYEKINTAYEEIKLSQKIHKKPLEELAKITDFEFYITTAIDDILEGAIRTERDCTDDELEIINYSLQKKSPKQITPKITVFKLMGNIYYPEHTAFDEEKMLEHLISIASKQNEDHPQIKRFIENVKDKTFLFIGCDFPGWLMRFFMRISTNRRLIQASPVDYVLKNSGKEPHELESFLAHCEKEFITVTGDSNTDSAINFVDELYQKWKIMTSEKETIQDKDTVFLSYHGEDVRYAENIKEKLEAADIPVWLDKSDLPDGEHEEKIRGTIANKCKVFVPFISENILKNPKLYARRVEWSMANSMYMAKKYTGQWQQFHLIPCITDDTNRNDNRIPEFLRKVTIFNFKKDEERIIDAIKNKFKPLNME